LILYVNDALHQHSFIKAFHIPLQDVSGSVTQPDSTENDWPHPFFTSPLHESE
jgi:hypothetical protein